MNPSNVEHYFLFCFAMIAIRKVPAWLFCSAAAMLIELDQARSSGAWLDHFRLPDTLRDIAADALAIIMFAVIYRFVDANKKV